VQVVIHGFDDPLPPEFIGRFTTHVGDQPDLAPCLRVSDQLECSAIGHHQFLAGDPALTAGDQISFHTPNAIELLMRSLLP
jgi:hypothetical protein